MGPQGVADKTVNTIHPVQCRETTGEGRDNWSRPAETVKIPKSLL